ncbi:hypothetical protein [Streptomyces sp. Midd1]|uniref:hypothetical protein n=1 Tax=Streptomyces sp. Midd3 TaxID=3161191 RepID=UPI0034DB347C
MTQLDDSTREQMIGRLVASSLQDFCGVIDLFSGVCRQLNSARHGLWRAHRWSPFELSLEFPNRWLFEDF